MGNMCGVTLRSKYFSSFRGASQRHDPEYAIVATAADYPPGKRSSRTTAAGPDASLAAAMDRAAPPPPAAMRKGSPAPAELTANVLGHPTPSLHDHYALGRHDPEYATVATAADYFSSFHGASQRHVPVYATVATAADYPPDKRSSCTAAAGPDASAAAALDGAAPPPAAAMCRGSPAPAELTANVLGHPTPSLHDHYALGRHDLEYATVATAADYFYSFGGASQRHDPEYATVATATDYPPGKRSSRTAAAGPDASAASAVDGAAPPPATAMRRGSPAPAELTANVLGHPTPSLHDHYALGCHDPEYATIATAAVYFSSFRGVTQRHDPEYATVATAADYPPGKRSSRTTAAGPNASAAPAVDGAAPPTAATMRRGSPAPAELTANVLGHPTPSLHDHYALGRKLGQGQFGTTYLCTDRATGADYACKSIAKCKLITKEDVEDVRREIQIMHHLAGHQNVVAIKGAYEGQFHVHIVMELCVGGELFDRIKQRGHYSERKAAELTRVIVGVVEACHSLGVMHRDLKPENFLLANKDDDMSLKAIDFGLSVFFKPGQVFTYAVGSPYYVAPEVLRERYGPEADVWAAGVILYVLLSGVQPFCAETRQGIFDAVLEGVIDFDTDPWPVISDSAKDLIIRMLNPRPTERLTAHEVLRHPWICDHGVAPDRPLDPAVLSCIKQFSVMNN